MTNYPLYIYFTFIISHFLYSFTEISTILFHRLNRHGKSIFYKNSIEKTQFILKINNRVIAIGFC